MKKALLAALGAIVLTLTVVSAPAHAADARNGVCEDGEFCLYFNSGNQGSLVDFNGSVTDYGTGSNCVKFISNGNGKGQCVKNNAASAWNRKSVPVTIFFKSDWSGAIDSFIAGKKADLSSVLKNENASHIVGDSNNDRLEYGLYHDTSAAITTYFDGYQNTPGRHEGIDIALSPGSPVYALTDGTVTNKIEFDSNGLSTLAIYNSVLDVTIVYLHLNPNDGLSAGDHVDRGDRIGVEDDRGAGQGAHTHVEMRPGRKTLAAPSVGDPVLDNPIPTQFWMNRGYNICCQ